MNHRSTPKEIDEAQKMRVKVIMQEISDLGLPESELVVLGYSYNARFYDDNVKRICNTCKGECWVRPYHPEGSTFVCLSCVKKDFDIKPLYSFGVQLNPKGKEPG